MCFFVLLFLCTPSPSASPPPPPQQKDLPVNLHFFFFFRCCNCLCNCLSGREAFCEAHRHSRLKQTFCIQRCSERAWMTACSWLIPASERHRGAHVQASATQPVHLLRFCSSSKKKKKNCCHGSTHCISTEGARLFFLVLFSTFSFKCRSWGGGPSLDQVPAVRHSHCLSNESSFSLIYVHDAFWQKKPQNKTKNRLKWHNCSLSFSLLPSV